MNMYYYAIMALITATAISIYWLSKGTKKDFEDLTFVFGIPTVSLIVSVVWPMVLFCMIVGLSVTFYLKKKPQ